ncbi:hypothetical protein GCK32_021293 [Trichostrongylus colubriformis]|uniref:Uncharacterized protein n=1 Tax=Trichostrongylus colubriformis TaxID=6319 RepID=A0AAN8IRZ7_TRICO
MPSTCVRSVSPRNTLPRPTPKRRPLKRPSVTTTRRREVAVTDVDRKYVEVTVEILSDPQLSSRRCSYTHINTLSIRFR